jgi:hypothetical protein
MRDRARLAEQKYRATHREKLNARQAARVAVDPARHLAAVKRSQAKYPDRKRALHRKWRLSNPLSFSLRNSLSQALKHRESGRDWRSDCALGSLIGCRKPDLIAHIEIQFRPGMSWENYGRGGWEIDHIIPCADFDLSDPAQQRACFHFTNLRPLWRIDNRTGRA